MILHVDMDAFFAAVEQRDNPALKGKPIVVAGHSKRSVVSTASYEARTFGVHSAMPVFQAKQKCPHIIILPGSRRKYLADSRRIMDILRRFSPLVEPVSIDEAFVDVFRCVKLFGPPEKIAQRIKEAVYRELSLTCSIGIAPVRFLAKIASDMNKPDGLTLIRQKDMAKFIDELPIGKVPGVGNRAMAQMESLQIKTLGDVCKYDSDFLNRKFGKMGNRLYQLSRGIDNTPIETRSLRKSISSETTLAEDISDSGSVRKILLAHAQRVGRELRKKNWNCRHVSIKIKFSDFSQITRGRKTTTWISSSKAIFDEAWALFDKLTIKKRIRLLGVGVSHFQHKTQPIQMNLIPDTKEKVNRQWESVDTAVDSVLTKFGPNMVQKASLARNQKGGKMNKAVRVHVSGRVQGVFFREQARKAAIVQGVVGYVRNMPDGSVRAVLQGREKNIQAMLKWCQKGSAHSHVKAVKVESLPVRDDLTGFEIRY